MSIGLSFGKDDSDEEEDEPEEHKRPYKAMPMRQDSLDYINEQIKFQKNKSKTSFREPNRRQSSGSDDNIGLRFADVEQSPSGINFNF